MPLVIRGAILLYGYYRHTFLTDADLLVYLRHIYYPTYCRFDGLTVGVGLAALKHYRPGLWSRLMGFGNKLLLAGVLLLIATYFLISTLHYFISGTVVFTLLAVSFGLLTAAAVSGECVLSRFNVRRISILAELSYSIYLTQFVAFNLAHQVFRRIGVAPRTVLSFILSMLVLFIVALALHVLVERPGLRLRDRLFAYKKQVLEQSDSIDLHASEARSKWSAKREG